MTRLLFRQSRHFFNKIYDYSFLNLCFLLDNHG